MKAKNSSGPVALITGGTRGIGLAIAEALKADGFRVAAVYQGNEENAEKFRARVGMAVKHNVSKFGPCEKAVKEVEAELGPIAVLVNNAGITRDGMLHKMTEEQWREVIDTNLTSCFNMCRLVINGMRERNYGRIINVSSINGQKGQFGQANYAAAKAGMIGFTKSLALENAAKGITVNAICPGYIETDMTAGMRQEVLESIIRQIPVARMGRADEIAAIAAFLASDKAGYITGSTITANGGQYMV